MTAASASGGLVVLNKTNLMTHCRPAHGVEELIVTNNSLIGMLGSSLYLFLRLIYRFFPSRSSRIRGAKLIRIDAMLSSWLVERPTNWTARVNAPLTTEEWDRVTVSIEKGQAYGEEK